MVVIRTKSSNTHLWYDFVHICCIQPRNIISGKMKRNIFTLRSQGVGHVVTLLDRIGALVIEYK